MGEKRGSTHLGENHDHARKRIKMKDLQSIVHSAGNLHDFGFQFCEFELDFGLTCLENSILCFCFHRREQKVEAFFNYGQFRNCVLKDFSI